MSRRYTSPYRQQREEAERELEDDTKRQRELAAALEVPRSPAAAAVPAAGAAASAAPCRPHRRHRPAGARTMLIRLARTRTAAHARRRSHV